MYDEDILYYTGWKTMIIYYIIFIGTKYTICLISYICLVIQNVDVFNYNLTNVD